MKWHATVDDCDAGLYLLLFNDNKHIGARYNLVSNGASTIGVFLDDDGRAVQGYAIKSAFGPIPEYKGELI